MGSALRARAPGGGRPPFTHRVPAAFGPQGHPEGQVDLAGAHLGALRVSSLLPALSPPVPLCGTAATCQDALDCASSSATNPPPSCSAAHQCALTPARGTAREKGLRRCRVQPAHAPRYPAGSRERRRAGGLPLLNTSTLAGLWVNALQGAGWRPGSWEPLRPAQAGAAVWRASNQARQGVGVSVEESVQIKVVKHGRRPAPPSGRDQPAIPGGWQVRAPPRESSGRHTSPAVQHGTTRSVPGSWQSVPRGLLQVARGGGVGARVW